LPTTGTADGLDAAAATTLRSFDTELAALHEQARHLLHNLPDTS